MPRTAFAVLALGIAVVPAIAAAQADPADQLRALDPGVVVRGPVRQPPLGGLLALVTALYEDDVRAVVARGGLSDYESVLATPFTYLPFDAVVPGVLATGDLPELATAMAPRPLRLESLGDGTNRRVPADRLARVYAPVAEAYKAAGQATRLLIEPKDAPPVADWLAAALRD